MSDIDADLQRRLRDFADGISPEPGRSVVVVRSARTKRRLVALSAGLAVVFAVGGLAGAATLLGDRDGIKPAPGPEQTRLTHHDLASMGVDQLAAALFRDDELGDAVPTEAGFSLTQIIRHGPDRTRDDYATVGVQMDGPVDYSRVNFFVHPSEEDAAAMGIRRSELLRLDWKAQRDEGVKPFAAANALPGTQCGLVYGQLLSCHAVVGRVLVLTQSGDEGASPPQVTDKELDAAMTLIRSFGSYLERVYPEHEEASVARYVFEARSRDASASGVLEVNSQEGALCYEAATKNIQASHLLRNTGVVAGGPRFERNIVVTFFDPDDREHGAELPSGAPICFQEEQLGELEDELQALIDHPEEFRVVFQRGPEDEPGLVAELQSQDTRFGDGDELLAEGPRWLGQVLTRAGLSFRNDFRPDGGGGHSIDSLRMILWSTNPTRATAREEADRWGYEEIWSGAGPTVFGANRAESPTAYLYWRAGGVDNFAQVDKEPGSQSIAALELPIREIIRQQERYPYPGDASARGGGSRRRDLTRPGHYELSDFDYRPTNDDRATRVTYTISWSGESFPGTDEGCFVIVQTKQGTERYGPFSITSADPRAEGANEIPVAADEIEKVYVECAATRNRG